MKRVAVFLVIVLLAPLVRLEMRCPRRDSAYSECKRDWKIVWPWWRTFLKN